MPLTGHQLIAGTWQPGQAPSFAACNPATGETLPTEFTQAVTSQLEQTAVAAHQAFLDYRHTSPAERAGFLRACASAIMALGDELLDTMQMETGYLRARCEGERARTCGQLEMFAKVVEAGDYLDARIDTALPRRQPLARPDIRSINQPLGVVLVFAVSNFPLAFSTAGGDTASALAAGCPVIVKGHPSHPGTGELVAQALASAVDSSGMPAGVVSFIQCATEDASRLVQAPQVKAVAFTGSQKGGLAISQLAARRPEPIPVFAEMGSINPFVVLPECLDQQGAEVASGYVASLTLGTGQFCVNPGLVLVVRSEGLQAFLEGIVSGLSGTPAGVMLNAGVSDNYKAGIGTLESNAGVECLVRGAEEAPGSGCRGQAGFYRVTAAHFMASGALREEVFGPAGLLVVCENFNELYAAIDSLQGQLTGTVHATESELADNRALLDLLAGKVGRLVINGYPTGVEVCHAMVHGGPFPATTDARFTSVGSTAIRRFVRPVCFQGCPESLLPDGLRDSNPLGLRRLVDGEWQ